MADPDWSPPAIARRIDEARERVLVRNKSGKLIAMSQGELERRVGMVPPGERGRAYIARWRKDARGTSMKVEWIVKLALELKVELMWLLAGIGPRERPEGVPPAGGRDLGLFIAAITGQPADVIDTVRTELSGKEHENESPLVVANIVEHRARVQRNTYSAQAAHASLGKEQGEKNAVAKRKATRAAAAAAKKRTPKPAVEAKPASRRKLAVDGD